MSEAAGRRHPTSQPASVTELALLRLPRSHEASHAPKETKTTPHQQIRKEQAAISTPIRAGLQRAKAAMEQASGEGFAYYLLDPPADTVSGLQGSLHGERGAGHESGDESESGRAANDVLLIGGWPSVAFHCENWIPTPENQSLVAELGELGVGTRWMWHVGIRRGDVENVLDARRSSRSGGAASFGDGGLRFWRGVFPVSVGRDSVEASLSSFKGDFEMGRLIWAWRLDDGFWAEGEQDVRAGAGDDAAELVVLSRLGAGAESEKRLDQALNDLSGLAVHVVDRRGVVLDDLE